VAATSGVARHLSGLASGLVNTAQQIGGSIGLAALTGIAASSTTRFLTHAHSTSQATVAAATVHGFHDGFYVAACFGIAASILALVIIKRPKNTPETADTPIAAV
jgi:sugar phosphate permease